MSLTLTVTGRTLTPSAAALANSEQDAWANQKEPRQLPSLVGHTQARRVINHSVTAGEGNKANVKFEKPHGSLIFIT